MVKQQYEQLKISVRLYENGDILMQSTEQISYFKEDWIEDWEETANG